MQNLNVSHQVPTARTTSIVPTAPTRHYPQIRLKRIALPTEHGGWGFLAEPLVAGLAIAFSPAAPWIALMMIGAFLSRQPLRVFAANWFGRRDPYLERASLNFVLLYLFIFAAGFAGTVTLSGTGPMLPFFIILPLAALQIYFDVFRRSRALIPEIAGAVSISSSVAVIALAAGFTWPAAVGLWLVFVARLFPSILYVRERLCLEKGKAFSRSVPVAAHASSLLLVAILAFYRLIPALVIAAMIILLFRAIEGLSAKRKKMRAMQIGVLEIVYGTSTVLLLVVGYYAGL